MTRCVVIVLDSGGIGALPDAASYGDTAGANTIGNVAAYVGRVTLPNFERPRSLCRSDIRRAAATDGPASYVARLRARAKGIHTDVRFPTNPGAFPPAVGEGLSAASGVPPFGTAAALIGSAAWLGGAGLARDRPIYGERFGFDPVRPSNAAVALAGILTS